MKEKKRNPKRVGTRRFLIEQEENEFWKDKLKKRDFSADNTDTIADDEDYDEDYDY